MYKYINEDFNYCRWKFYTNLAQQLNKHGCLNQHHPILKIFKKKRY